MAQGTFKVFIDGKELSTTNHVDMMTKQPPGRFEVAPVRPEQWASMFTGTMEMVMEPADIKRSVMFYKSVQPGRYMHLQLGLYAMLWEGKGPHQFWGTWLRLQGGCRPPRGWQKAKVVRI